MATDARQQATGLTDRLVKRGDKFSFFQALRLLRLHAEQAGTNVDEAVRVRPRLGMGFPQTDIQQIEQLDVESFRVTANFLGLYGVDSPLPMFYTEDLLEEQADGYTINREFLDIFAQSIYPLFFQAWLKTRPSVRVVEYDDQRMLAILYSFVGIDSPQEQLMRPGVGSLLRAGAHFSQQKRTAAGLQSVVQINFPEANVTVRQLQPVWVDIPTEQRCYLGQQACELGGDSHVGGQCRSLGGVTIVLDDLPAALFLELIHEGQEHERFRFLVDYYLIEPVPLRVDLSLRKGQAQQASLGSSAWSMLGANTWLLPSAHQECAQVTFNVSARRNSPRWM